MEGSSVRRCRHQKLSLLRTGEGGGTGFGVVDALRGEGDVCGRVGVLCRFLTPCVDISLQPRLPVIHAIRPLAKATFTSFDGIQAKFAIILQVFCRISGMSLPPACLPAQALSVILAASSNSSRYSGGVSCDPCTHGSARGLKLCRRRRASASSVVLPQALHRY